ncbi:MAG TPA: hypothetical protein VMW58_09280 [Anaerolineae bacterium]|nr:hypothetical protein [Anaerolineae bacterium]
MGSKRCPKCQEPMRVYREECEAFCDDCMIVVFMRRAAFNDLKAEAATFEGTEDEFATSCIVPNMARRAYRAARRSE